MVCFSKTRLGLTPCAQATEQSGIPRPDPSTPHFELGTGHCMQLRRLAGTYSEELPEVRRKDHVGSFEH